MPPASQRAALDGLGRIAQTKELEEKFTNCTQKLLSPERRRAALDAMWNLDKAKDLTAFMHQLAL